MLRECRVGGRIFEGFNWAEGRSCQGSRMVEERAERREEWKGERSFTNQFFRDGFNEIMQRSLSFSQFQSFLEPVNQELKSRSETPESSVCSRVTMRRTMQRSISLRRFVRIVREKKEPVWEWGGSGGA